MRMFAGCGRGKRVQWNWAWSTTRMVSEAIWRPEARRIGKSERTAQFCSFPAPCQSVFLADDYSLPHVITYLLLTL